MNQSVITLVISNQFRQKYLATSAIIILVFGFVYIILNTSSNHPLLMSSQETKPFPETFEPFFEPLKITQKIIRSNSRVIEASEFNLLEDTELELSSLEMCTLGLLNHIIKSFIVHIRIHTYETYNFHLFHKSVHRVDELESITTKSSLRHRNDSSPLFAPTGGPRRSLRSPSAKC